MNEITACLFHKDLSETMVQADLEFSNVVVTTLVHGGYGSFSGDLRCRAYDAYRWYADYHNYRLKAWDSRREVAWEGRVEDVGIVPGYGVEVMALGYWKNFFDVPLKDDETWSSDTHYPEDIIETIVNRCCRQIAKDFVGFEDSNRNVAPFKIEDDRFPSDVVQELLAGGNKWGTPMYLAVWEGRTPEIRSRHETVDWYVRLEDCESPPVIKRSMENMSNAVLVKYTVEGEAGDVNDSGVATGERGNNFVTLTDDSQGWDEGQWDSGFDVAIVGGTGIGQIRDVLRTRAEADVVDSGRVMPFRTGVATCCGGARNIVDTNGAEVFDGHFTWRVYPADLRPLSVHVISGACAGQTREIEEQADFSNPHFNVPISSSWTPEDEDDPVYPSTSGGGKYIVMRPATLVTEGKSWVHQAYNSGFVVEIVKGRGAGQRRGIEETKQIKTGERGIVWDALILESDWDVQPDETSYYEIHRVSVVLATGTATDGGFNTLIDSSKSWAVDRWKDDFEVVVISGKCSGQKGRIISNTTNQLTIEPLWDNEVPDSTTKYEIRTIREQEDEEAEEGACTQLVVTSEWTTQPDGTSEYEIRQKVDGGTFDKTTTRIAGQAVRDIDLCKKRIFSIGSSSPGEAERVAGRLRAELKYPQVVSSGFVAKRVFNSAHVECPLIAVRAGDVVEIEDLFPGEAEVEELDRLKRFFIIQTSFDQSSASLTITPDNVEMTVATMLASAVR